MQSVREDIVHGGEKIVTHHTSQKPSIDDLFSSVLIKINMEEIKCGR